MSCPVMSTTVYTSKMDSFPTFPSQREYMNSTQLWVARIIIIIITEEREGDENKETN